MRWVRRESAHDQALCRWAECCGRRLPPGTVEGYLLESHPQVRVVDGKVVRIRRIRKAALSGLPPAFHLWSKVLSVVILRACYPSR